MGYTYAHYQWTGRWGGTCQPPCCTHTWAASVRAALPPTRGRGYSAHCTPVSETPPRNAPCFMLTSNLQPYKCCHWDNDLFPAKAPCTAQPLPMPHPPGSWEYKVTGTSLEQTLCVFSNQLQCWPRRSPWIKYVCGRWDGPDGIRSLTHLIRTPKVSQETASTQGSVGSHSAGPTWDSRSQGRGVPSHLPSDHSSTWQFVKVTASFPFTPIMCF